MRVALFALAVLAVVACKDSTSSGCAATTDVTVGNDFFSPTCAAVSQNATVTWTWNPGGLHNVTFEDTQFSSSDQATGAHQRTFGSAGTFRYRCTIHSASFDDANGMIGRVEVQ